MSQEAGLEERRMSSTGLLIAMAIVAAGAAALMFQLGMGALGMSGPARELNTLLDRKTKICADRSRSDECGKILKRIEILEKEMARKAAAGRGKEP